MMIFEFFLMIVIPFYSKALDCNFKFEKNFEEIFFSIKSTIVLSCVPTFDYDYDICKQDTIPFLWYHNSTRVIEKNNHRNLVSLNQELIIFYAQDSDAGTYICDTENKFGQINKTFQLRFNEPSQFHNTLVVNLLPPSEIEEKKNHIYWLPEMLTNTLQQSNVKNNGEDKIFYCAYYLNSPTLEEFQVDWYFQYEGSENRSRLEGPRYEMQLEEKPCNSHSMVPRNVSGKCYFSRLIIPKLNYANQGLYHSVAHLGPLGGVSRPLNLTYSLTINIAKIHESEGGAHMIFNFDTKVCSSDYFDFKCKLSSDSNYYTVIKKINANSSETKIAESEVESVNIMSEGKIVSNGNYIPKSGITHRITSVSFSDAGIYICMAMPLNHMTESERAFFVAKRTMELTVISCTASLTPARPPSWHNYLIWPLIVISLVTFTLALLIYFYHYYSHSFLVKTVIVQHPNKLYVPHDTSSTLMLPQVSIRTSHKFPFHHGNSCSKSKPLNHISGTPFSQKLSKYFQKTCIFNYRPVNESGSSPAVETIELSDANSSKSSSNSTKEDYQSRELVVKNNSQIRYILPPNIGWIFSRDSIIVGSKIGEGAFGIVFDGIAKILPSTSASIEVAIKTLHDSFGDEDLINLIKEMEMLKLIGHHQHIISLYGAYVDNGHPYMVMELAKNGNLRDFLRSKRNKPNSLNLDKCLGLPFSNITLLDLLRFGLEIASGMEFLSSKMIIHRDLAARNILVDQYLEMKIADFGLTRAVENYYRKSTDGRLPIKWMAPECLLDRVYTVKSDVWSFGIVLWEIFTMGQTPYPTTQPDNMHQVLRNGLRNEKPPLASDEIYNVMLTIWNDDPLERPSFSELVTKLSHIQIQEVPPSQGPCNNDPSVNSTLLPTSTIVKDYLELSSTQCYSTTNI